MAGLAPACGSDDDENPPPGGKGGTAGTAGRGGSGGSGARGGSAGNMGSGGGGMGGSGGVGGTAGRGGSAGTNGAAGSSGTGGTAGGDASPDSSTGGTAGTAGASGTAGADASPDSSTGGTAGSDAGSDSGNDAPSDVSNDTSDAAAAGECIERCTTDNDCRRNDAAVANTGCRNNRCVSLTNYCESTDAECRVLASSWTVSCSTGSPCTGPLVCIDVGGGVGRCAAPQGTNPACLIVSDIISMPRIDGSGNVDVCGDNSQHCDATTHTCAPDCTIKGCPPNTACNTTTKLCGCTSSAACAPRPGTPSCNTTTGACECATDTDCNAANVEGDVCVNGKCRCSGISACIKAFDGTTETCE